jgi:hypothetical protein
MFHPATGMDAAGIALIQGTLRKSILRTSVGWELTAGDFPGQRNAGLPAPDYDVDQRVNWCVLKTAIFMRCGFAMVRPRPLKLTRGRRHRDT